MQPRLLAYICHVKNGMEDTHNRFSVLFWGENQLSVDLFSLSVEILFNSYAIQNWGLNGMADPDSRVPLYVITTRMWNDLQFKWIEITM